MAARGLGVSAWGLAESAIGASRQEGEDRPATLSLRLFGQPAMFAGTRPLALSPSATMLCAYLALAPHDGRSRTTAAAHLFADCAEPVGRRRLNTAVWRLKSEIRSIVGSEWLIQRDGRTIGLDTRLNLSVDVSVFEALVRPALEQSPADLPPSLADRLAAAVKLHRGPLLESCDDEWVLGDRYRTETLYLTALDYLIQHHGRRHDVDAVSTFGQLALDVEPLREDVHRHLMRAYASAGRVDLVEGQYERCRLLLRQELGTDVMPETEALRLQLVDRRSGAGLDFAALVAELEHARADVARLARSVDRALDRLRDTP